MGRNKSPAESRAGERLRSLGYDGADAVRKARKYKPDIVLLDVAMPKVNGLVAARIIKAELPATRIVMLSMHASPAFMREAFTAGASAYVLKENAARELPAQMRGLQEDPIAP